MNQNIYLKTMRYRWQIVKGYTIQLPCELRYHHPIYTRYIKLTTCGKLTLRAGYTWDGASGPVRQTDDLIESTLIHDALYQLMREGHIDKKNRKTCDKIFWFFCRKNRMGQFRAWYLYIGVRLFGWYYLKSK